jgi:integrase
MTKKNTIKPYTTKTGKKGFIMENAHIGMYVDTGKPYRTPIRASTKKGVQLKFERLRTEFRENGYRKTKVDTFGSLYDMWFKIHETKVSPATAQNIVLRRKNHIGHVFDSMRIDKISVLTIQTWLNKMVDAGKSNNVINYSLSDVKNVLAHAVSLGVIPFNPALSVIKPKGKTKEKKLKHYTKDQLIVFLGYLRQKPQNDYTNQTNNTFFTLLANSGMRSSEVLALKWTDIKDNRVYVERTWSQTSKKGRFLKSPKTASGKRDFVLDPVTLHLLKVHHMAQNVNNAKMGIKPSEFIFTDVHGEVLYRDNVNYLSGRIAKVTNLPSIGLHGFRHTHATLLYEAGVSAKAIQERLGHKDIQTTLNTYTHITTKTKEDTAQLYIDYVQDVG